MRLPHAIRLVATFALLSGCGPIPAPPVIPPTQTPDVAGPCGRPVTEARPAPSGPALYAAAMLRTTVDVDATTDAAPQCFIPVMYGTVHLHVGDRVEFVANGAPGLKPEGSGVVTVAARPGPVDHGPGFAMEHVVVTLTAVHAGEVTVSWIDCSGTGC